MMLALCGFIGLFVLRLIRRHGWEYVPVVLLAFGAWFYFGSHAPGLLGDGLLFTALTGVHLVTRKDIVANRSMAAR